MKKESGPFPIGIRRQGGFSLMELMVVIAILGTLSAIAIPNILSYRDNARVKAGANEMLALFRKAQVVAVKRHFNTGLIFNVAAGTTTLFVDNGAGGGVANDSVATATEISEAEVYTVPVGCKLSGDGFAGQTGFSQRGLPLKIGAIEVQSTSAGAKARYKASLSMAGHTKLEVSTDGGTNWQ